MSNKLFIYGTLLDNYEHPMSKFLHEHSTLVGEGTMPGKLYKVAWYPGAIHLPESKTLVYGQVVAVRDIQHVFSQLDQYEGPEYQRKIVPIEIEGETVNCWVYLYIRSVAELEHLKTGRFIG